MTSHLAEYAKDKKPVAINEVFGDWAVDTMAALVYSIDLDSRKDPSHPLMMSFEKLFSRIKSWQMMMMFTMPRIYKLCQPPFLTRENTEPLKTFVSHMIREKRKKDDKDEDILQLFIDAAFENVTGDEDVPANGDYSHEKSMTLDDITAQAALFFGAGTDTVSSAMTFSAYLLALNPGCQERLLKEVDDAVKKDGITYDTLQTMPYLEASIKEAMRMYTADSFIMRLCTEKTTVAGVPFEPGMNIDVPFVGIHYDPEFFPDPETFKPERFLPQNKDNVRPFTYLAFGAGPRNCVGMRLAMVQAKVALASILRHFKFQACPETMVPVRFKPRNMIPQTDGPLMLRLVTRNE